jgi:prevent-host-death family protein
MGEVASRDLRNRTRSLLERVGAGERITITVDGRPVAVLEPVARRSRWLARREFVDRIVARQADPALTADLASLSDDTTDDVPLR